MIHCNENQKKIQLAKPKQKSNTSQGHSAWMTIEKIHEQKKVDKTHQVSDSLETF